jgi:hypothetical protein
MENSPAPHGASVPPTHYVVNKYSSAFQAIVEAYGVARYREHNPTPYTIVTFPFLFAVMFGDAGHGLLMLAAAVYFIVKEEELGASKINEMVQTPFDGRYVMFLMSFFAIYCGVIYNEVFGMPLNLYGGTRWHFGVNATMAGGWQECYSGATGRGEGELVDTYGDDAMFPGCNLPPKAPYPVGMDPIWKYSSGGLIFFNSLKMKMSVVFGVVQMVFGIILKATNDIKHKRPLDLWCEFVPQMIFMNGIFGYMVVLVLVKWNTCWVPASQYLPGGELVDNDINPQFAQSGNAYYTGTPKPYCTPVENINVLSDPVTHAWKVRVGGPAPPRPPPRARLGLSQSRDADADADDGGDDGGDAAAAAAADDDDDDGVTDRVPAPIRLRRATPRRPTSSRSSSTCSCTRPTTTPTSSTSSPACTPSTSCECGRASGGCCGAARGRLRGWPLPRRPDSCRW